MSGALDVPTYTPHYVGRPWVAALTVVHVAVWIAWGCAMRVLGFGLPWYFVLVSQYVCETLALLTHWLGHRPETGWWFDAHTVGHHTHDYPASRFLTSAYEPAKQDNSQAYVGALLVAPALAAWLCGVPSLYAYVCSACCCYMMLVGADTIHMALHTRHHAWERWQWFRNLRALHYWHHKGDMKRNYAIGDFFLDWALLGIHF